MKEHNAITIHFNNDKAIIKTDCYHVKGYYKLNLEKNNTFIIDFNTIHNKKYIENCKKSRLSNMLSDVALDALVSNHTTHFKIDKKLNISATMYSKKGHSIKYNVINK